MSASPTPRLLIGLAVTLAAVALFSWYSLHEIASLRELQTGTIDRNRKDSLQLLRIQNDLNSLALAMRDMSEGAEPYGIEAWRGEFQRIRDDLRDALEIESRLAMRPQDQQQYLSGSLSQFWISADQIFGIARTGDADRARKMITNSLEAQQAAMSGNVARLLVQNNESEQQANSTVARIYSGVQRNVYLFVAAILVTIAGTTLSVIYLNRKIFDQLKALSEQRSTLARKLIGVQEDVLRSVSRELHDEFGQILTAVGAMLARAEKKGLPEGSPLRTELTEVRQIVQETLEKVRSLSQALHPTVLDDYGLEKAMERFVPAFEKQTGIAVSFTKEGAGKIPDEQAIHIYRVLQESLNNVARHSGAAQASVHVAYCDGHFHLKVEDRGTGFQPAGQSGLGLIAMRERAELLHGTLSVIRPPEGGTRVTLSVPLVEEDANAMAHT
jgi:signal transduction histidine kinase